MTPAENVCLPTATTAELRAALEPELRRQFGRSAAITRIRRCPSPYYSSFVMEQLEVEIEGHVLHLMFKDLSPQAMSPAARSAKPAFLCDPRREIELYQSVLAPEPLGTARCYGAVWDERAERYWLFLEKVPGLELYQVGDFATWQQVARSLAALHAHFAVRPEAVARARHLLRYDAAFYRRWLHRARVFLGQRTPPLGATVCRGFEALARRYDQVVECLGGLPTTLVHGEFYASNILVQGVEHGLRVCPVDWELAAVGPGLMDLAALVAGKWTEDEKEALALAYHAALPVDRVDRPTAEDFLRDLHCCRLHLAVQWLGWSAEWRPPAEHDHDWLGEALMLAEERWP